MKWYHVCRYRRSSLVPYRVYREEILSRSPFISLLHRFLSATEARQLVNVSIGKVRRHWTCDREKYSPVLSALSLAPGYCCCCYWWWWSKFSAVRPTDHQTRRSTRLSFQSLSPAYSRCGQRLQWQMSDTDHVTGRSTRMSFLSLIHAYCSCCSSMSSATRSDTA